MDVTDPRAVVEAITDRAGLAPTVGDQGMQVWGGLSNGGALKRMIIPKPAGVAIADDLDCGGTDYGVHLGRARDMQMLPRS